MITKSNVESHDRMERQFNWPEQESLQLCDCVTSTGRRRKWTGGTEVRLANTSSKALRGEERDEKRGEESQEDAHRNENRWKEMTGGEKSLEELRCGFTICNKRSEVPEKSMEVCRSSYRQTLFLEPIALHFLNLETSATRLAGVLFVHALYTIQWYLSIYIYIYIQLYLYIWIWTKKWNREGEPNSGTQRWKQTLESHPSWMVLYEWENTKLIGTSIEGQPATDGSVGETTPVTPVLLGKNMVVQGLMANELDIWGPWKITQGSSQTHAVNSRMNMLYKIFWAYIKNHIDYVVYLVYYQNFSVRGLRHPKPTRRSLHKISAAIFGPELSWLQLDCRKNVAPQDSQEKKGWCGQFQTWAWVEVEWVPSFWPSLIWVSLNMIYTPKRSQKAIKQ